MGPLSVCRYLLFLSGLPFVGFSEILWPFRGRSAVGERIQMRLYLRHKISTMRSNHSRSIASKVAK